MTIHGFRTATTATALGFLLLGQACSRPEEKEPKPVVEVKLVPSRTADVQHLVEAPATIFPRQQANIAARITSPIVRLAAKKGDTVRAGQVLAELDDSDLVAQRREAVAVVADAEANLQKTAQSTLPMDIERAKSQVSSTEAAVTRAQKIYDRRVELLNQGAIASREVLTSQTELAQAKADYDVARKSMDLLLTQSSERDLAMAKSRRDQAKARLELLDRQIQFTRISSPFTGAIVEQFMYPGDMAKPDAPIFTVIDLSASVARAQIPEAESGGVAIGQRCLFSPTDSPGAAFEGKVSMVNLAVDPARRTVEVWAEILRNEKELRAGVFGRVRIVTGTVTAAVVVPLTAVQFEEGTRRGIVMVVDPQNIAHQRKVETGEKTGDAVRIIDGVAPGELVVAEGGYGLPDGTEVRSSGEKAK
jgi:HlyD family secretion protein